MSSFIKCCFFRNTSWPNNKRKLTKFRPNKKNIFIVQCFWNCISSPEGKYISYELQEHVWETTDVFSTCSNKPWRNATLIRTQTSNISIRIALRYAFFVIEYFATACPETDVRFSLIYYGCFSKTRVHTQIARRCHWLDTGHALRQNE